MERTMKREQRRRVVGHSDQRCTALIWKYQHTYNTALFELFGACAERVELCLFRAPSV